MFEFHEDRDLYFRHQVQNSETSIIPFIERVRPVTTGLEVMEVGCGEGGVLKAFVDRGCQGFGVDLAEGRVAVGRQRLAEDLEAGRLEFEVKDIYDPSFQERLRGRFDLILLKDVIEHIHDQGRVLRELQTYLRPGGLIFFGFPPWYMPFGGHQQMCQGRFLSKLPYFHLLPMPLYKGLLRLFKEHPTIVEALAEIKDTGISIERFERLVRETGYEVALDEHYLINPIYAYKFGLKARRQWAWLRALPFIRNFFTTGVYYLIRVGQANK